MVFENKIKEIKRELTELACLAIKLSIKIMSKLIKYISEESKNEKEDFKVTNKDTIGLKEKSKYFELEVENSNSQSNFINDLLNKTKIFLKMTRLIIENAKSNADLKAGKSNEFFKM